MHLLFYGLDGDAAKAEAQRLRGDGQPTRAVQADACREAEAADGVAFTDDVPAFEVERLKALFGVAEPSEPDEAAPAKGKRAKAADVVTGDGSGQALPPIDGAETAGEA